MDRWTGRIALVTGASSGIGAGLTRELVKYGVRVAACARNLQRLQDLKEELKTGPGEVLPIQCDLRKDEDILAMFKIIKDTYGGVDICVNNAGVAHVASLMTGQTEHWRNMLEDLKEELKTGPGEVLPIQCDLRKDEDILAMFKIIKDTYGGVDICVNNAGVAHVASLMTGQTEHWRNMLEVNVLALCTCTREALTSMKERGVDDGHIIHIGSTAAYEVSNLSYNHVYPAAKHAVRTLTEGLRRELNEVASNIRVTIVSPGLTNTEIVDRMFAGEPELYRRFVENFDIDRIMEVSDVVSAVIYALASPDYVHVNEILMRPRGDKSS